MVIAHIFVGDVKHRYLDLGHVPRVGETLRMPGDTYVIVTEVVWALDECGSGVTRVNIGTEPVQVLP